MTSFKESESVDFEGPAGRIEALINRPPESVDSKAAAVICHAHPLHGGMMHYKVIFRVAKALQSQGISVLRFNFRGVGRSEGVHDNGNGEQADVQAAVAEMERRFPGLPMVLGGFSFGSVMAAKVSVANPRVKAVLIMGFPIIRFASAADLPSIRQPRLFIQGSEDQFGSGVAIRAAVAPLAEPKKLVVIEGADHFFTGRLDEVQPVVEEWAATEPWALA